MAGDVPPQESGLTCSTWYGKHHTEMIWWHTAHFSLWGHDELLAKNLRWYQARLPEARALAASRGLRGARWAKMVGPEGRESPGGNPLIVWNQPHMIYLCELLYRSRPSSETLAKYRDLVLETADCLASMVHFDERHGRYVLGPPLWIAQEIYDPATSQNPAFELSYWRWALGVAQQWRERLGMPRDKKWDDIIARLSPLPVADGKYVALESHPDTWENINSRHDHPEMLMPLGLLPGGPDVDRATMERTLDAVLKDMGLGDKDLGLGLSDDRDDGGAVGPAGSGGGNICSATVPTIVILPTAIVRRGATKRCRRILRLAPANARLQPICPPTEHSCLRSR